MARRTDDTIGGGYGTTSFADVRDRLAGFGVFVVGLDVSHLGGDSLHEMIKFLAAVDGQVSVCRSNLLTAIDALGGDPVAAQKTHGKASHSASKKNTTAAKALSTLPAVKAKLSAGGGMTPAKAALLGGAADKTSADAVNSDLTLLGRVESQDEDRAKQSIDKWVRDRQSNGDRKSERQKNIDARQFAMFTKHGMVHTHGQLPADEKSMALFRRWEAEKTRLWRCDGGRENAHRSVRSDDQRGADAYQNLLDNIDGHPGGLRDRADWCNNIDNDTQPMPQPTTTTIRAGTMEPATTKKPEASTAETTEAPPNSTAETSKAHCDCGKKAPTRGQIVISARAEQLTSDDPDMLADIIGGRTLIRSELDRLMCNSELYGMLFDPTGNHPLWHGRAVRHCTDAQWRALLIRDGGCVLTGVDPSKCEAHHTLPFEAPIKGKTDITELAMVSVSIHHWLHANQLTLYRKPDGTWHTRAATPDEIAPRRRKPTRNRKPARNRPNSASEKADGNDRGQPTSEPPTTTTPNRPKSVFTNEITGEQYERE